MSAKRKRASKPKAKRAKQVPRFPPAFPATILVFHDTSADLDEPVLLVEESVDGIANETRVAVYKLEAIKIKRETHTLVDS